MKKAFVVYSVALILAILAGCATNPPAPPKSSFTVNGKFISVTGTMKAAGGDSAQSRAAVQTAVSLLEQ